MSFAQQTEIWGKVFNGTEDSSLVNNAEVELLIYRGHQLIDDSSFVSQTNADGVYRFSQLPLDSLLLFYPRTTFHEIVYYGTGVRATKKWHSFQNDIVVYDSTSNKNSIYVAMEHIFITQEKGVVTVKEVLLLTNRGKRTYLGVESATTNINYVLQFPLPDEAENLEILTPEMQNTAKIENGTLYDTALFSPGSKQISFQFQILYKGNEWQFNRAIIYPTGGVNLFLSDANLKIDGPNIKPMGDFNIKGKNYQHYSLQQYLMPGMPLAFTLKNLPRQTMDIKWIVLTLVAVFLVVGFIYTFLKK